MKIKAIKIALGLLCLIGASSLAQAQQRFGDNLGNHRAATDLDMNTKSILNAAGVAIGSATLSNASVALQVDGADKAVLISRVTDTTAVAAPLPGMIVFNTADNTFYVRNNTSWVSYSLAITEAAGINSVSDVRGYTLTNVGQNTVLMLSPADATNPGIVTVSDQTFAGNKTFTGNVAVDGTSTLTVGTGATTLGGTLGVAGEVTVGSAATAANTILNGKLNVSDSLNVGSEAAAANTALHGSLEVINGITTLSGVVTPSGGGPAVPGVIIPNAPAADGVDTENFVVLDAAGNLKRSSLSAVALAKNTVAMGTPATPFSEANQLGKFVLTGLTYIKQNDGIVVNFDALTSVDIAEYLTITNAMATADEEVTIWVADLRQPAETDPSNNTYEYTAPDLTNKNFVITRYRQTP